VENRIEKGDKVDVFFSNGEAMYDCEVLYLPCATGDSWILKDKDNELVYVQMFEMIRLKNPTPKGGEE
jgi:hypothetical protein